MTTKENEAVAPAQTDPALDKFFTDNEELLTGAETVETEETPEAKIPVTEDHEPDDVDTEVIPEDDETHAPEDDDIPEKFKGKTVKDLIKSYQNLEALYGKKAAEPKPVEPSDPNKVYTMQDIPIMSDSKLDEFIAIYEDYLMTPDQSLDDAENFGRKTIEYNKLMMEKAQRNVKLQHSTAQLREQNNQVKASYDGKKHLDADEFEQVVAYAVTKLSDNGELTIGDMDVAMHKLFPDKWIKRNIDKDKQRIASAQTRQTPRIIPGGGANTAPTGLKSFKEISAMDEYAYEQYLEKLSPAQLEQHKKIIKRGT